MVLKSVLLGAHRESWSACLSILESIELVRNEGTREQEADARLKLRAVRAVWAAYSAPAGSLQHTAVTSVQTRTRHAHGIGLIRAGPAYSNRPRITRASWAAPVGDQLARPEIKPGWAPSYVAEGRVTW